MKKSTLNDFGKSRVKKTNQWLTLLSLCTMLLFGPFTLLYGAEGNPKNATTSLKTAGKTTFNEPGSTCITPLTITSLPYAHFGNTATYGNDYVAADRPAIAVGAVTNGTGATSYMNGFDVVYAITPIISGQITVNVTNDDSWMALWAFTGCPFTSTVGYHTATSGTSRSITNLPVVTNTTYYFMVSNWNAPGINYSITVTGTAGLLAPLEACAGMPNAGTAALTPNTGNSGAVFNANATGVTLASGLTYHWQKFIGGTWQNIAGADTVISSITAETGPIGTVTDYRLEVTCTATNQTAYSTTATYSIVLVYCVPTGSSNNSDEIRNFTLNNLNNNSTASEGVAGYINYAGLVAPAQLELGVPYNASLTSGTAGGTHGAAIWIDYNQNGTFETTEKVAFIGNTIASNSTVSFPEFIVPTGTALGVYRLRVQYVRSVSGELLQPCLTTTTLAETEDYSIEVFPIPTCLQPSALESSSITATAANLSWTSAGSLFNMEWGPQGFVQGTGTTVAGIAATSSSLTNLLPDTFYSYYVRQDCGATNGLSLWTGPHTFTTTCAAITGFFQNFDTSATGASVPLPACWLQAGNGTVNVLSGSLTPNSGVSTFVETNLFRP